MDGDIGPWLIAALLILFADYVAIAETALSSVSKTRMKALAEHGDIRAEKVVAALDDFDRTISTILILTNIAHLAAAAVITVAVTNKWGLSAVTISTIVTSLAVFFAAEMLPKSIAKKQSEKLSLWCISSMTVFIKLLSPLSKMLAKIGDLAGRLTKGDPEVSVTEDEIYDIIEDMTEEGTLDEEQGDLISSALQFGSITAESVLTPRVDVVAIDIDDSSEEILEQIKNQNHSRLPVYEGTIDNIIGVLRIRTYIKAYLKYKGKVNIRSLLDKPQFVTESATIDELLPIMTKTRHNLAIVTDHYGGTVGIITVEDILESLVGEIWDEDDVVEDPIVRLADGSYLVDAEETVGDVFEEMEVEPAEEDDEEELLNTRLGEWVYEHFSFIPKAGDFFTYENVEVKVSRMEHNRIRKVLLTIRQAETGGEEEPADDESQKHKKEDPKGGDKT